MSHSILLIPRIKIHNANALSSPYTIGFPAMTAWLGTAHALERKIRQLAEQEENFEELDSLRFPSVAVVCHDFKLHTYKGNNDFEFSIVSTGNPLDKSGKRPSFIEEARCDLVISLLIEYDGDDAELVEAVTRILPTLKMASGDIQDFGKINIRQVRDEPDYHSLVGSVMPGFCLIERRELMRQAMQDGQDALDALLDYLKVSHHCEQGEDEKVTWSSQRREKGWLVPVATGFQGISEPDKAEHQRASDTPHRFAESIVTLGEFIMPYRLESLDQMLWQYQYDHKNNFYLCQQSNYVSNT